MSRNVQAGSQLETFGAANTGGFCRPTPKVVRGRPQPMHRWASAAFGLLALAALAIVVLNVAPQRTGIPPEESLVSAAPSASASAAAPPTPSSEPNTGPEEPALDGGVPPLPPDAPSSVEIGVIQFTYRGAERAPQDAPAKEAALERAQAVLAAAREDFDAAVSQGDAGSAPNLGRIPRGVLEPGVEYVVFTLEPGQVSQQPLDTPRGYWIVRRTR